MNAGEAVDRPGFVAESPLGSSYAVNEPLRLVGATGADPVVVAGPVESFDAFLEGNQARLYGALCLITRDRHEAEEIAQEAFVRILERWDRVGGMENPAGYLYRTAMNLVRSRYRRAMLAVRRAAFAEPRDDAYAQVEAHDLVVRAMGTLPADQRAALVVTTLLGYSSEEAGQILGIRASTVRARATRARAALRDAIGDER